MEIREQISLALNEQGIPFRNSGIGRVRRFVAITGPKGSRVVGEFVNVDGSKPDMLVGTAAREPVAADLVKIQLGKFREI